MGDDELPDMETAAATVAEITNHQPLPLSVTNPFPSGGSNFLRFEIPHDHWEHVTVQGDGTIVLDVPGRNVEPFAARVGDLAERWTGDATDYEYPDEGDE